MQRDAGAWKLVSHEHGVEDFTCGECGESFHKPLLATILSCGESETYYACPRCMTKVKGAEVQGSEIRERESVPKPKLLLSALDGNVKCGHFMGYLKQRPRETPIPEECLLCDKMVDCLAH